MSARSKILTVVMAVALGVLAGCADPIREDAQLRARWAKQDAEQDRYAK